MVGGGRLLVVTVLCFFVLQITGETKTIVGTAVVSAEIVAPRAKKIRENPRTICENPRFKSKCWYYLR